MNGRTAFYPLRSSVAPAGGVASLDLPSDLQARTSHRIQRLALVLTLLSVVTTILSFFSPGNGPPSPVGRAGDLMFCVISAAVYLAVRSRRLGNARVRDLGMVYEVLLCLNISVGSVWVSWLETGHLPPLTWTAVLIVLFPLVIPSRPRRTLITALAGAATAPLGLGILAAMHAIPVRPGDYIDVAVRPLMCVALAYFGSRVIYGISMDVARAREMGSYHLESLLGRGGMGEVWRASHRLLARPAAIKLIRVDWLVNSQPGNRKIILERFEREAQATAAMRSPHTVQLYDYGVTEQGFFYYAMELLDGLDLQALVERHGPLPPERTIHLLAQVCHSLAEAHGKDLIHRDIKPANVYVCRYGREFDFVKLLDFGLVESRAGADATETMDGTTVAVGTLGYMSPEQVLGSSLDARADLYSVGCLAYWLLTGRKVFDGENPNRILLQHVQAAPGPPSQWAFGAIPPGLDAIVLACLEKDPDRRPQSADALAQQLMQCTPTDVWSPERAAAWWKAHVPAAA